MKIRYFDAVGDDGSSLVIVYFSGFGFDFSNIGIGPYYAQIAYSQPNGSLYTSVIPATGPPTASSVLPFYSQGQWPGLGSWSSTLLGQYSVSITDPYITKISANLTLTPTAPPNNGCNGLSILTGKYTPDFGWANVMPAATASASISMNGQLATFQGSGEFLIHTCF